ncbi:MAG: diheme cytochrome c [Deltaproteobacteria bacterium]|nr:diheme cytochrome c [Deltaproteobacteria bacterium]
MKNKSRFLVVLMLMTMSLFLIATTAYADKDEDDEKEYNLLGKLEHSGEKGKKIFQIRSIPPVTDTTYLKECGACHFAYQPGLLPEKSWEKIFSGLESHFGEDASLSAEKAKSLREYAIQNSAEKANSKRANKILRSIKGEPPLRASDTPYLIHEHNEFPASVLKRKSIMSIANCGACHTTADRGIYSERYIHIPK